MTNLDATQNMKALGVANETRTARRRLKVRLRSRELKVSDVLRNPPPEVESVLLIDLLKWDRARYSQVRLRKLGRDALREHVNLLVTVGQCSERVRLWVADNLDGVRPRTHRHPPKPMSEDQRTVLAALSRSGRDESMRTLSALTGIEPARVANAMAGLSSRGLIYRVRQSDGQRWWGPVRESVAA